jgi:hypothetical protein
MSIRCPHCDRRIEGAVYRYEVSMEAIRRVIMRAESGGARGVHSKLLAKTYQHVMKQSGRSVTLLAARRAVERLAKDKLLVAVGNGYYRAANRARRLARDKRP